MFSKKGVTDLTSAQTSKVCFMVFGQDSLTFDSRFREGRARKDPNRVEVEVDLVQL